MRIVISDAIRLYNKETEYESFSVSQEYLQSIPNYISELETLLCSHFTVKEALQYYFSFNKKVQNEKLYLPLKTCDKVNHLEFVCCDFHRSLSIMKMIILQWLNYYYYAYGLHYYALDRRKIYMTSANGLALLAHVAAIDLSSMKDVPADVISIDPSVFRKDPYL